MSYKMALKVAIDLVNVPSRVRLLRSEPLPDGVLVLLHIAAGDAEAERVATALTDETTEVVRRAAVFFIEQILFAPDVDSYRVLGANPQASSAELRRNLALLLRWLHPDTQHGQSIYIGRVTAAWNDLKTAERRAAYDSARREAKARSRSHRKVGRAPHRRGNRRPLAAAVPLQGGGAGDAHLIYAEGKAGFLRRALSVLFNIRS
jgi:hypothetical protein